MDNVATPHYPPAAVARLTGLSIDTLRAWERRYGAVAPSRDARGRLYTERDVARLRLLAALVADGHSIGRIAALPPAALRQLRHDRAPVVPAASPHLDELRQAMAAYDVGAIERTLSRHALLLPPRELIFSLVLPLMRDVGSRWEDGAICIAQEHLVSSAVRNVLGGLLRSMAREAERPTIVFAAPAGQRHELGLLCAAVLAASARYTVIYLGADLPSADISHAVRTANASMLVLAGTIAGGDAVDLRDLRKLSRRVQIIAAGRQASSLQRAIGARARRVERLEDFAVLLDTHA